MTLNDFDGYLALNSGFAPDWLAETARIRKIIAIDIYCQRCKSLAGTLVSGSRPIRFVRIFCRVL